MRGRADRFDGRNDLLMVFLTDAKDLVVDLCEAAAPPPGS